MKEKSEKAGLKLNIQKTKIMVSSLIISWQIEGGKMETVTDFIFLGSKINAENNCSHEIKRPLLLGRIVLTNLDQCIWRRQWHPTPALLPGKSHGRRSLVGYSPWGRKESDMTERLHFTMAESKEEIKSLLRSAKEE